MLCQILGSKVIACWETLLSSLALKCFAQHACMCTHTCNHIIPVQHMHFNIFGNYLSFDHIIYSK